MVGLQTEEDSQGAAAESMNLTLEHELYPLSVVLYVQGGIEDTYPLLNISMAFGEEGSDARQL